MFKVYPSCFPLTHNIYVYSYGKGMPYSLPRLFANINLRKMFLAVHLRENWRLTLGADVCDGEGVN